MDENRTRFIKKAAVIAIIGNAVLALIKIVFGLLAGSLAVVGDGIDTTTDIITSLITLFAAIIMARPPDKSHPYGHLRAEAVATKTVSFVIFFVGAQLALSSAQSLIAGSHTRVPSVIAIYVTIASIAGKIFLAYTQFSYGKRHESPMIIANAKNMLNDIFISAGVLIGLFFTLLFERAVIDTILALAVSVWVMKTAIEIFLDTSVEVMEGIHDHSVYDRIFVAVDTVDGASNPHRARIRQISNYYVIDLDIEVDPQISVARGHEIAVEVEERIKQAVQNVYDIMVHIEPQGNLEADEAYGLAHDDARKI